MRSLAINLATTTMLVMVIISPAKAATASAPPACNGHFLQRYRVGTAPPKLRYSEKAHNPHGLHQISGVRTRYRLHGNESGGIMWMGEEATRVHAIK